MQYCEPNYMKQDTFLELLAQGLIHLVTAKESEPSKGKPLDGGKTIWVLQVTLSNGNSSPLFSSRGSQREWASLDTLNVWLKTNGVSNFQISHMEVKEK
jgi:hypothetical protein